MNDITKVETKAIKKRAVKTDLPATPENMLMTALQQGMSIDIIEKLIGLKERLEKSEAEKAFREAMSKFQAECPVIKKKKKVLNKDGTSTRYKYAPTDDIVKIVSPIMAKHNLSFTAKTRLETRDEIPGMVAIARISHILGYTEETEFWAPIDDNQYMTKQQRYGSTRTFTIRYALSDGLGIITGDEDNDTNDPDAAKKKEEAEQKAKEAKEQLKKFLDENEYLKKGFEVLEYTERAQWSFCNGNKWNAEQIKNHLNLLVEKQDKVEKKYEEYKKMP